MKKSMLMLLVSCSFFLAKAQDKIPSYGKVDKADLEMKDCSFDPGAEAVVLFNTSEVFYFFSVSGVQIETNYRIRIKVLKEKGIDEANVTFPYYSKNRYDDIHNIAAQSYNLDNSGNIITTELEKKQVFDKKIDEYRSEISFAVPDVKVGTVFEYKYKKTRKSYSNISPWVFQKHIPVAYSEFTLQVPDMLDFTYQLIKRQEVEYTHGKHGAGNNIYIMRNIPGLKDEPFAGSRGDYYQRVEFTLKGINQPGQPYIDVMGTWKKATEELLEDDDFGGQLKKNIKDTPGLEEDLAKATDTKNKIRAIYNYVQKNMNWNGDEYLYSLKGVKDAWDKKNGSVTDINLILVNLLKDNGIEAMPALASSKENGSVNQFYPDLNQFDRVLAVAMDGDEAYIMSAAEKTNPYYLIPEDVLFTSALILDKKMPQWVSLSNNQVLEHVILVNISPENDGKFTGDASITSKGYGRSARLNTYKSGGLKKFYEDNKGITITVDSFSIKNDKDDTKELEQAVTFSGKMDASGGYSFLPFNLFSGLIKNPFIEENRVMDIDFGFPQRYTITGNYFIPDGYMVEELPANTKLIMPDTSISLKRISQKNGNVVQFRLSIEFLAYGYRADDYPYVKEFFQKMYEMLDDRIVLKKKN